MDKAQRHNWSDIVREHPDKWIFMTDVNRENGNIKDFVLLTITTFDERDKWEKHYLQQGLKFERHRTTLSAWDKSMAGVAKVYGDVNI